MIKISVNFILIILLVLFQINFFSAYSPAPFINFVLMAAVLISIYKSFRTGLIFCLIAGAVLDLYSSFGFGCFIISLITPVVMIYYIFRKLLAHHSIYTVILVMIVSTVVFNLIFWLIVNLEYWLGWSSFTISLASRYFIKIVIQVITHLILTLVFYFLAKIINTKIRSKFFISEHA